MHESRSIKPWVHVSSRFEGGWATVRMRDNGQLIPAEVRDHIFEPFFPTLPGERPGLGLAVCHSIIVGQLKGRIGIEFTGSGC